MVHEQRQGGELRASFAVCLEGDVAEVDPGEAGRVHGLAEAALFVPVVREAVAPTAAEARELRDDVVEIGRAHV